MKVDVVAIGELLIDFTCISIDDEGYPTLAAHPGGAPANFLTAVSRCGLSAAMIGKVGADMFGKALLKTLDAENINCSGLVMDQNSFTTMAFVSLNKKGDREFSFARKPGADTMLKPEELKIELIDEAKVLHFGTLSLTDNPCSEATRKAVTYAKQARKIISFDPNLRKPLWDDLQRAKSEMIWGLKQADIVKVSDDEIEFMLGMPAEAGAEYILQNYGCKIVFATCGEKGCYYATNEFNGKVPAVDGIQCIDTTGAGDTFGGFALAKIIQQNKPLEELTKEELEEAATLACTAAGLSTTRFGGISSIPKLEECEGYLKNKK